MRFFKLNNYNVKKYSIYIYINYIMNIQKEKILKIKNIEKMIYIKNNALINMLCTVQN
jgi:hypothetical protein